MRFTLDINIYLYIINRSYAILNIKELLNKTNKLDYQYIQ